MAIKEIVEDFKRYKADQKINNHIAKVWDQSKKQFIEKRWTEVTVGDIVKVENEEYFPADLVILSSSQEACYVETSNLDGETNLKLKMAPKSTAGVPIEELKGIIECEKPNRNLYKFTGNMTLGKNGSNASLTKNNILLRGSRLMNTDYIYGAVIYTGHETKLHMSSSKPPMKRSRMDGLVNYVIVILFISVICLAIISALLRYSNFDSKNGFLAQITLSKLLEPISVRKVAAIFKDILTFIILYSNIIPVSLLVTVEFVHFYQVFFIEWDRKMYYQPKDAHALARTSHLNEELGEIQYIFSDKTGTLTQNVMEYKKASIGGVVYENSDERVQQLVAAGSESKESKVVRDFLTLLSICHTVIPVKNADGSHKAFNASSPDERALVEGAAKMGYTFHDRKMDTAFVQTPSSMEEFQILNIIEFTSARRRMSVIARGSDGRIVLYIKGADSVIFSRLGKNPGQHQFKKATLTHLNNFAREGFRTLCYATKVISEETYRDYNQELKTAELSLSDRETAIEAVATKIETDLTLIGASAIEDKLQEGVPETIANLIQAGIKVWVLTGDKKETAINIGYSCKLLTDLSGSSNMVINTPTLEGTRDKIKKLVEENKSRSGEEKRKMSLIIEGVSLMHAFNQKLREDFIELCCSCKTVICCRVSPSQKAFVVELVQKRTQATCLSIGDGANDVAMIQKAQVGVGISGNEGMQAVNNSDFAIAQFRFLQVGPITQFFLFDSCKKYLICLEGKATTSYWR